VSGEAALNCGNLEVAGWHLPERNALVKWVLCWILCVVGIGVRNLTGQSGLGSGTLVCQSDVSALGANCRASADLGDRVV
jgi:hypothetical protein